MTTSAQTRNFLHLSTCASFVLLVAMVTRTLSHDDGTTGRCPVQKFGSRCRLACQCENEAVCDDVTGRCPGACRKGWSGPSCQTQNVVLGKPTKMKTTEWSKGDLAVDGDKETCVTSSSNRTGWWRVDMLVPRSVFYIEIVFVNQIVPSGRLRAHVSDYTDTLFWGKPCTRIPSAHKRSKFACDVPSKGRYFGIINKFGQISLCEVHVLVCSPYTFGTDCSVACDCADPDEVCNPVNGECKSGCREGWTGTACQRPCVGSYGHRCRHRCGHCKGGAACDHVTGSCPRGCLPGWVGPQCTEPCEHGFYGKDCTKRCNHCLDLEPCDPVTGTCPWRCQPGWQGAMCDEGCSAGTYGQSCNFSCGQCYPGTVCDRKTGVCPMGCSRGFQGLFCTKACISGLWGINCRWKCGQCTRLPCDERSGQCDVLGCQPGWKGVKCDIRKENISPMLGCDDDSYGPLCVSKCGNCLNGCDVADGSCPSGCLPGWHGPTCSLPCSNHTHGQQCRFQCGQCAGGQACHHVTGHCPGQCREGAFQQPSCLARTSSSSDQFIQPNLYTLLICCIIVVVCLLCAVGTSLFVVRWRRSRPSRPPSPPYKYSPTPMQQTTV